jgi:hypothetical protein
MVGVIVLVAAACLIGGTFALFRWDERRQAREDAEWNAQIRKNCAETVAYFRAEDDREKARVRELVQLSWPELRAWHERISGNPCECPTKAHIAKRIYYHERHLAGKKPEALKTPATETASAQ